MTDLNRRSLLAMLASIPLLGGLITKLQASPSGSKESPGGGNKVTALGVPEWPILSTPPNSENPGVRLIFQGLMVFCHDGKECDIGLFRDDNRHRLEIEIFENCVKIFSTTDVNNPVFIRNASIKIDGEGSGVSFFHQGLPSDFNRITGHKNDFWWLLDLDAIYGKKLDKDKTFSKTKLTVKHGVFYTYQRTNSTFRGVGGPFSSSEDFEYIAKIMAADIVPAPGQSVSLKINGHDVFYPLKPAPDTKYEVYFNNECWTPNGKKCKESDFHLNFKATKLGPNEKFDLKVKVEGKDDPPPNLCITREYAARITDAAGQRGTDAAPCMGVGFGKGGGLPQG